jgi:hypothetical protein
MMRWHERAAASSLVPLSCAAFARRLAFSGGLAAVLLGASLLIGMAGYRYFEGMEWIDAFANAATAAWP